MSRNQEPTERALAIYRGRFLVAVLDPEPGAVRSALRGQSDAVADAVVSGEIRALDEEELLAALIAGARSLDELRAALEREGYAIKSTPR